ncbi:MULTISPECIES: DUF2848 domain-containing protein [Achromobacter]|jgi:hypothetical protein|uniref:DUF2848 domain-containing protein n=1 Tax=Achromobacter aegrifaciens TaxID=1287736 RepID=A0AAD2QDC0_ACHAE|nr:MULTISPECIES: DUF2848 domain-containing protein [Achromobacter]PTN49054.1 DUF2848 domain-containing protein [Achromobacter xylosoxidans]MBD9380415.1 DUF2848 domain-containing protein [Achromobacter sp. ACM02]MBD9418789.1 DUF2848 domain-containing protein [Achromobacter sp. ACM04]MBD9429176.1 DUF2848 domain-containing protein [Achromobacter sp. ACM03]MBD9473867.1 DUF2848 domain-containing protein [Achromobacter sp. ACM01]
MKAVFQIEDSQPRQVEVEFNTLIVAGWAGRDMAAIEHHIEELAAIGVPRPSSVPLYYRIADNQLTQKETVQALGEDSSGEVETFVFSVDGEMYVSIASDHTDRKLETYSVAMSKQVCVKPVATSAWRLADVADYWDELIIRSYIVENGVEVLYQEGPLASLRTPQDLIAGYTGGATVLPAGAGMTCGTVGAIGGIRAAADFTMELHDPRRQRSLRHRYHVETLPVVA